jgi:hypothetical protein
LMRVVMCRKGMTSLAKVGNLGSESAPPSSASHGPHGA